MEKNQIIGYALIFVIIMAWVVLNKPIQDENQAIDAAEQTVTTQQNVNDETSSMNSDQMTNQHSTASPAPVNTTGIFGNLAIGSEDYTVLENDKIKVNFSNKGGRITSVQIKGQNKIMADGDTESTSLVELLEDDKNSINYRFSLDGEIVNTKDLYATPSLRGNEISFTLTGDNGAQIIQKYKLADDSYMLEHSIATQGMSNAVNSTQLEITNYLDRIEENYTFEKTVSTVYYKVSDEGSDYCSCRGDDVEDLTDQKIDWFSFSNQFFNTAYITKGRKLDGIIATIESLEDTNPDLKKTSVIANIPLSGSETNYQMDIYVGPNEYDELERAAPQLEQIIPFGRSIFGSINRHFIRPFFNFLSGYISSKGVVIILIIFIIKMALYPLTYKMLYSQAKMGALKPELAKMKGKYKDDAQKQQMETMKVYREYGVNPMGGCLPMFVQMPIWYALFRFFPASITFRQESFLWASDLSSYDDIIQLPFTVPGFGGHLSLFTILWALATVVYTYYNMKHMDMTANPAMKYVQYLMPLMFFVFFNNYASGLTCYMFFSQLITISQTILTKKFVFDDEKILAELNIKKSQPKKKSGFQARLAEAMDHQRKMQEQKLQQSKKKKK